MERQFLSLVGKDRSQLFGVDVHEDGMVRFVHCNVALGEDVHSGLDATKLTGRQQWMWDTIQCIVINITIVCSVCLTFVSLLMMMMMLLVLMTVLAAMTSIVMMICRCHGFKCSYSTTHAVGDLCCDTIIVSCSPIKVPCVWTDHDHRKRAGCWAPS